MENQLISCFHFISLLYSGGVDFLRTLLASCECCITWKWIMMLRMSLLTFHNNSINPTTSINEWDILKIYRKTIKLENLEPRQPLNNIQQPSLCATVIVCFVFRFPIQWWSHLSFSYGGDNDEMLHQRWDTLKTFHKMPPIVNNERKIFGMRFLIPKKSRKGLNGHIPNIQMLNKVVLLRMIS